MNIKDKSKEASIRTLVQTCNAKTLNQLADDQYEYDICHTMYMYV